MTQRPPRRDRDASSPHVSDASPTADSYRRPSSRSQPSLHSISDHRHIRLQQVVHEELDALVRDELTNPILLDARVRGVVLTRDHRSACVHVVFPAGDLSLSTRAAALDRAASFLRRNLAETLSLKRTPDLRFVVEIAVDDDTDDGHTSS